MNTALSIFCAVVAMLTTTSASFATEATPTVELIPGMEFDVPPIVLHESAYTEFLNPPDRKDSLSYRIIKLHTTTALVVARNGDVTAFINDRMMPLKKSFAFDDSPSVGEVIVVAECTITNTKTGEVRTGFILLHALHKKPKITSTTPYRNAEGV